MLSRLFSRLFSCLVSPFVFPLVLTGSLIVMLVVLACTGGGDSARAAASTPGTVSFAWSITDAQRQPTTCDQVGAANVLVFLHDRATGFDAARSVACADGRGTTQALTPGTYDVTARLRAADGTTIVKLVVPRVVTVIAGQVTRLAPLTFVVDAVIGSQGRLVISIATLPGASNCKSAGASITGNTITLINAGGSCAAVTFLRARQGLPTGTYTVDCGSPQAATCIETDETLTVPSLESGTYTIHVRGKLAAVDCWKLDEAITVPGAGKTLTRKLQLQRQNIPGCM